MRMVARCCPEPHSITVTLWVQGVAAVRAIKRLFDGVAAAILLVLLLPVLLVCTALVKATSAGPALYVQDRVGRHGRRFRMLKLRTMHVGADRLGTDIHRDDPVITPVGRWLRRYSLDELPQLWHVLTGEMSLVGPRPAPPEIVDSFSLAERRRESMRPGLTGWAQVSGRNELTWAGRIELDLWYVDHWSFGLDLLILWRTVGVVLGARGLYGRDGWNRGY